jgi:hypothetical protein
MGARALRLNVSEQKTGGPGNGGPLPGGAPSFSTGQAGGPEAPAGLDYTWATLTAWPGAPITWLSTILVQEITHKDSPPGGRLPPLVSDPNYGVTLTGFWKNKSSCQDPNKSSPKRGICTQIPLPTLISDLFCSLHFLLFSNYINQCRCIRISE